MLSTRRPAWTALLGLALSLALSGCATGDVGLGRRRDRGTTIGLVPQGGGATTPWSPGPTAPEPTFPPAPDTSTPPPVAPRPPSVPTGNQPASVQEAIAELRNTYGIRVGGYYTTRDIEHAWTSARQYLPQETRNLSIAFSRGNRSAGVMGMYYQQGYGGAIEIYDHDTLHTLFHELTHHITLGSANRRAKGIAQSLASMTLPRGGPRQASPQLIPRSYARTNLAEYWAEFFSYLREQEQGLQGGYPCSRSFNPPENVRRVARQIYAN